jgi:hypothetical protein
MCVCVCVCARLGGWGAIPLGLYHSSLPVARHCLGIWNHKHAHSQQGERNGHQTATSFQMPDESGLAPNQPEEVHQCPLVELLMSAHVSQTDQLFQLSGAALEALDVRPELIAALLIHLFAQKVLMWLPVDPLLPRFRCAALHLQESCHVGA